MLTFKRLIHMERKGCSNPMNLYDLLCWSMPSEALCVGHTTALSKDMSKNSPQVWEKETPFKTTKQISTSLETVHLLEFPSLININVNHSCWFGLHLDNQLGLINFSFCFWSVSAPMFSGFSTELLPTNPRFGHGRRAHLLIYSYDLGQVSQGNIRSS